MAGIELGFGGLQINTTTNGLSVAGGGLKPNVIRTVKEIRRHRETRVLDSI